MINQNEINKVRVNTDLLFIEELPNDHIRRVIKKLAMTFRVESLSALARSFDITNVTPSTLNIIQCNMLLASYATVNGGVKHPKYRIETEREIGHVIYHDNGIRVVNVPIAKVPEAIPVIEVQGVAAVVQPGIALVQPVIVEGNDIKEKDEGRIIRNRLGMLHNDTINIQIGAATTLVCYYHREIVGKDEIENVFTDSSRMASVGIPAMDFTTARRMIMTGAKSPVVAQSGIYDYLNSNHAFGLSFVDRVYGRAGQYSSTSAANAKCVTKYEEYEARVKNRKNTNKPSQGCVPVSYKVRYENIPIEMKTNYGLLWNHILVSQGVRGGDSKGIGSLTVGYYSFDMPTNYVKAIARAREILKLCEFVDVRIVRLPSSKEYSSLTIEILVNNGLRVVGEAGVGSCKVESPPGFYSSSEGTALRVVKNPLNAPAYSKAGAHLESLDFDMRMTIMDCGEFGKDYKATLTFLIPSVVKYADNKHYSILPSLSPHSGKIWLFAHPLEHISPRPTVPELLVRSFDAVLCRNVFPLIRRSYCNDDKWRCFFKETVIIPRLIRKEVGDKLVLAVMGEMESKMEILESEVDQIVASAIEYDTIKMTQSKLEVDLSHDNNLDWFFKRLYEEEKEAAAVMILMRENRYNDVLESLYQTYYVARSVQSQQQAIKKALYHEQYQEPPDKAEVPETPGILSEDSAPFDLASMLSDVNSSSTMKK